MNKTNYNFRFLSFSHKLKSIYASFLTDYDEKIVTIIEHEFLSVFPEIRESEKNFYFAEQEACDVGNEKLFFS